MADAAPSAVQLVIEPATPTSSVAQSSALSQAPADSPAKPSTDASDESAAVPVPISVPQGGDAVLDWPSRLKIHDFEKKRVNDKEYKKKPGLALFYKHQNELIDGFVQAEERITKRRRRLAHGLSTPNSAASEQEQQQEDDADTAPAVRLAINLSFAGNVILFIIKIFASIWSGSIAVVASAIDSSLDLVSGSIIFVAALLAHKRNLSLYPVGKTRLEPLSIIVFASVMGMASLQLLTEGATRIVDGVSKGPPAIVIDAVTFGVLAAVIAVKFALMLWCWKLRKDSPSVDALFTDHRNDVITNTSTIVAVLIASRVSQLWWFDSLMAIVLALLIMFTWANTGREYIVQLTGHVASPEILSQLTYLAFNHDSRIKLIDTVRAYHFGTKLMAEVDIVLPPDMPLQEAHDIGESLQKEIEGLDDIERAFVHLDYECEHRADDEHAYPE
jgi:cation diffusion facilitator family transporter